MSTEQNNSFSSIISVNPYNNEYISGVSSFLSTAQTPEFSKEQLELSKKSFTHIRGKEINHAK